MRRPPILRPLILRPLILRPRLLLGLIAALAVAPAASASTITVTATADGGPGCTLRAAIAAVDSPGLPGSQCRRVGGGDNVILMPSGTFRLTTGAELPVTGSVTIAGAGVLATTISGDSLTRIFDVAPGASLTLRELALTEAQASISSTFSAGAGARGDDGGAIRNAGVLRLVHMEITDSHAGTGATGTGVTGGDGGDGGAVYNTGLLMLDGVSLTGNSAGGGGTGGSSGTDVPVFLEGGSGGNGGAIANVGGSVTISASTFADDSAGNGGEGGPGAPLSGAVAGGFGGNGGDGGGIWSAGGAVSVTNSTFTTDAAGVPGAGGFDAAGGTGGSGGAVATDGSASVTLLSDTLTANEARAGGGGGIYAPTSPPGPYSGGYGPTGVSVEDSALASDSGGNCAGGAVSDGGHNLSFGDTTCPPGFRRADPRLGALQDNGGPTYTMALAPHSAALGAAPLAGCPVTDQRGVRRIGSCDIGAWQFARPRIQLGPTRPLSSTTELLLPLLDVNDGTGSLRITYGVGRALASEVTVALPAGVAPVHIPVVLRKLKPLTRYRYAIVITTPDGFARSWLGSFSTSASPQLSSLEVSDGQVRYHDSRAATTRLELLRCARQLHGRCASYVPLQRLSHHDAAGANQVRLHPLRAGAYELLATPTFRGLAGRRVTLHFRVG